MLDLVSLGELLIDFTPVGVSDHNNPIFERNPGGGPANMLCAASKLGLKTGFIGQVGDDNFGHALRQTLRENKIDTANLLFSKQYKTTLAFVHLDEEGDRSFSFYRKNGADTMLRFDDVDLGMLERTRCFFFSSVLLSEGDSRETSYRLAEYAREQGALTVFDPNLRENLWEDLDDAKECIQKALNLADIVKVSEEELYFLTDHAGLLDGGRTLLERYGLKALLITLGAAGCCAVLPEYSLTVPGFSVRVVDTTAAGDSFTGGFLYKLLAGGYAIERMEKQELLPILRFANAVGALTTTKKGSIHALPDREEVLTFLRRQE